MNRSKKELVYQYFFEHPTASVMDCYNELECGLPTVKKWYASFVRENSSYLDDQIEWPEDEEYCEELDPELWAEFIKDEELVQKKKPHKPAVDYNGLASLSLVPLEEIESQIDEADSDISIARLLAVISNKSKLIGDEIKALSDTSKLIDHLFKEFNVWCDLEWKLYKKAHDYLNISVKVGYRNDMIQAYRQKVVPKRLL